MVGEFTGRFDREILNSELAAMAEEARKRDAERQKADALAADIEKISGVLEQRAQFVMERFPNAERKQGPEAGFVLAFGKHEALREALFIMRARTNESQLAILVESRYEIDGDASGAHYDYVSLPVDHVDHDRAKRFIENMLLDFARTYVGN